MKEQRGTVYTIIERSGNTVILKHRAGNVTFEEFAATVDDRRLWLADKPTQGHQTILTGPNLAGEPVRYGAFVFEGADIKAVEAVLTEEWGTGEEVRLVEHLIHMVLELPARFTEEEIRAAIQQLPKKYKILAVEMFS